LLTVSFRLLLAVLILSIGMTTATVSAAEILADGPLLSPTPIQGGSQPVPVAPPSPTDPAPTPAQVPANAKYLATTGSDADSGSQDAPYRTFSHALRQVRAGETLMVRDGMYVEQAIMSGSDTLAKGTPDARITVMAFPGENPVLKGILHLSSADYWTFDNIDVTWDENFTDSSQHMYRLYRGVGFEVKKSEIWGARSFAAMLINGDGVSNYRIHHNYIHDTAPSNDISQDHLMYVSDGTNGVIEHNLMVGSPNGRAVKLGNPNPGEGVPGGVILRYNTMVGNGSANTAVSYDAYNNRIYGNIMVTAGDSYYSVGTYHLAGTGNIVSENVAWDSEGNLKPDPLLQDGGGNLMADPQFDEHFVPRNPALYDTDGNLRFGHLATVTHE